MMLDCTFIKTFTPVIPAGTGPTFTDAKYAVLEIVRDLNESSGSTIDYKMEENVADFLAHALELSRWIDGTYDIFPDYRVEVREMQRWQLEQMPEFEGY